MMAWQIGFVDNFVKISFQEWYNHKNAKVLILGLTFKENCPDIRNTKVLDIIKALDSFGIEYEIVDPWVEREASKKNIY